MTAREAKEIHRIRQQDKFEPALTYYLFAALAEATSGFTQAGVLSGLLEQAFAAEIAGWLATEIARYNVASLEFEAQVAPNKALREAVARQVDQHPLAYTRQIAAQRPGVRFESATRLDCFLGDRAALGEDAERPPGEFGLGVEAKFISDMDDETTYIPHRNQIARTVEVGSQRSKRFVFLLIAPRRYRLARSLFYVYKMEEYHGRDGVATRHHSPAARRDACAVGPAHGLARLGTYRRLHISRRTATGRMDFPLRWTAPGVLASPPPLAVPIGV